MSLRQDERTQLQGSERLVVEVWPTVDYVQSCQCLLVDASNHVTKRWQVLVLHNSERQF